MAALWSAGHVIDLALLALAVEAVLLWRARGASAWPGIATALLPGACLLLALRVSVTGGAWVWSVAFLTAALPLHLADLWRRPPR